MFFRPDNEVKTMNKKQIQSKIYYVENRLSYEKSPTTRRMLERLLKRLKSAEPVENTNIFVHLATHNDDTFFEPKPAIEPTQTRVGSEERIRIYRQRVEAGEELTHPEDLTSFPEVQKNDWRKLVIEGKQASLYSTKLSTTYTYVPEGKDE